MATIQITEIQPGWDVYSTDGQKIGSTAETSAQYLTVRKGMLMPKDYFVPASAIQQVVPDQGQVYLTCGKDEFENQGWDQLPEDSSAWGRGEVTNTPAQSSSYDDTGATAASAGSSETQRIPRYEEELRAEKTTAQTGEVRVSKDVDEQQQEFEVPVTREDVEVRRVAVNRPAGQTDEAFTQQGDTLRIPVREEQVQVTKEPRVVEEIEVRKTPHEERQRVSDTVRRERVNVEGARDAGTTEREPALSGAGADRMQGQTDWDTDPNAAGSDFDDESDREDDDASPLL